MNLYNPFSTIKNENPLDRPYKGIVVQNTDEKQAGRIKVNIPELYGEYIDNGEDSNSSGILPWIYPRFYGSSGFEVPDVGDVVEVEFPYKNIYLGYYTNKPLMGSEKLNEVFKTENYPNIYGHLDRNNTGWYIDKVTDTIIFVQGTTESKIVWDSTGTLTFYTPQNLVLNVVESLNINAKNLNLNITEKTILNSQELEITSKTKITGETNIVGNTAIDGSLSVTNNIESDLDIIAKGSISLVNHTHTCPAGGGDSSPPK